MSAGASWSVVTDAGVRCVAHDGYLIEIDKLRADPPFWVRHVAGKEWATPEILGDLVAWVTSAPRRPSAMSEL